jgi:hypothetical protein
MFEADQRGRVGFPLRHFGRKCRCSVHAVFENDISVNIHHANGNRYIDARRLCFDAFSDVPCESQ